MMCYCVLVWLCGICFYFCYANALARLKRRCDTNIIRRMLNIYGLCDKNGIYTEIEFRLAEQTQVHTNTQNGPERNNRTTLTDK